MVPSVSWPSFLSCECRKFDSIAAKVSLVVIGLLLIGSALATHFLHINAIATYTLVGCGGILFFSTILLTLARKRKASLQILIKDRKTQLEYYKLLPKKYDPFPSCTARVMLDDSPTNGVLIWDRLIMIQGPHNQEPFNQMRSIVFEHDVGAIVRLGRPSLDEYFDQSCQNTIQCQKFTITKKSLSLCNLFDSTTYTEYKLEYVDGKKNPHIYAVEGLEDFEIIDSKKIYYLILELEKIEGKILVHDRTGLDRTGVFAVCWQIFQLYKEARANGSILYEVDPVAIVEQMHKVRAGPIQTDEQFKMILDFVDYLNCL